MELDFGSLDTGTIGRRTLMMVPSGFRTLTILKAFGWLEVFLSVVVFAAGTLVVITELGFEAGAVNFLSAVFVAKDEA
jgi:hypothetical protein